MTDGCFACYAVPAAACRKPNGGEVNVCCRCAEHTVALGGTEMKLCRHTFHLLRASEFGNGAVCTTCRVLGTPTDQGIKLLNKICVVLVNTESPAAAATDQEACERLLLVNLGAPPVAARQLVVYRQHSSLPVYVIPVSLCGIAGSLIRCQLPRDPHSYSWADKACLSSTGWPMSSAPNNASESSNNNNDAQPVPGEQRAECGWSSLAEDCKGAETLAGAPTASILFLRREPLPIDGKCEPLVRRMCGILLARVADCKELVKASTGVQRARVGDCIVFPVTKNSTTKRLLEYIHSQLKDLAASTASSVASLVNLAQAPQRLSLLCLAVMANHTALVYDLLADKADPLQVSRYGNAVDIASRTGAPVALRTALLAAAGMKEDDVPPSSHVYEPPAAMETPLLMAIMAKLAGVDGCESDVRGPEFASPEVIPEPRTIRPAPVTRPAPWGAPVAYHWPHHHHYYAYAPQRAAWPIPAAAVPAAAAAPAVTASTRAPQSVAPFPAVDATAWRPVDTSGRIPNTVSLTAPASRLPAFPTVATQPVPAWPTALAAPPGATRAPTAPAPSVGMPLSRLPSWGPRSG